MKLITPLLVIALSFLLLPVSTFAACDQNDDGDCCAKDTDCAAYFSRALCAVIALNKTTIKKLDVENAPALEFCKGDIAEKLKADVASKKPICLEEVCEFSEDNG